MRRVKLQQSHLAQTPARCRQFPEKCSSRTKLATVSVAARISKPSSRQTPPQWPSNIFPASLRIGFPRRVGRATRRCWPAEKRTVRKVSSLAMRLKPMAIGSNAHSAAAISPTSAPKSSAASRKIRTAVSAPNNSARQTQRRFRSKSVCGRPAKECCSICPRRRCCRSAALSSAADARCWPRSVHVRDTRRPPGVCLVRLHSNLQRRDAKRENQTDQNENVSTTTSTVRLIETRPQLGKKFGSADPR